MKKEGRRLTAILSAAIVVSAGLQCAVYAEGCEAADPVFIQPDERKPDALAAARAMHLLTTPTDCDAARMSGNPKQDNVQRINMSVLTQGKDNTADMNSYKTAQQVPNE